VKVRVYFQYESCYYWICRHVIYRTVFGILLPFFVNSNDSESFLITISDMVKHALNNPVSVIADSSFFGQGKRTPHVIN
jgi:hypothetical protein